MTNRSTRDLGAMEAQFDPNFEIHFIELHNLEKIIDNDSDIIYGLKGSGKTALSRALTELNVHNYFATKTINLDSISFSQIHAALQKLKDTTKKEIVKLSSNTWRNVLMVYAIEIFGDTLPDNDLLKRQILDYLKTRDFNNPRSNNRFITFIQNLLINLKYLGLQDKSESPLGLTAKQLEVLDTPFDAELINIITKCNDIILGSNKKILICLDGLDSVIEHSPESRRALFAGLVDAIYKCSKDKLISPFFCFKAFLPRELTDSVKDVHFDSDKFIFNNHYLNWNITEFEMLLTKRMSKYTKTKSSNFKDVWNEIMPEKIQNPVHNIEENTLKYILRHTLYRPRHLLIHLQYILDNWDAKNTSPRIDPSFIPKIVSSTNFKLAEIISGELEYAVPGVTSFLHSLHGISSTLIFGLFKDRMKRMFNLQDHLEMSDLFDRLFNLGIIGFVKDANININHKKSQEFNFAFTNGAIGIRKIYNSLDNDDVIALSPIFQEYCGCKYSEYGAIFPI